MLYSEKETKQFSESRLKNSFSRSRSFPCGRLELLSYKLCYVNRNAEKRPEPWQKLLLVPVFYRAVVNRLFITGIGRSLQIGRLIQSYRTRRSDSLGCVFACEAAEGYTAARSGAAHEVGIAACRVVAGAVTNDIELFNGAAVSADGGHAVIDLDTIHRADEIPAALARSEERGRVQGRLREDFMTQDHA